MDFILQLLNFIETLVTECSVNKYHNFDDLSHNQAFLRKAKSEMIHNMYVKPGNFRQQTKA